MELNNKYLVILVFAFIIIIVNIYHHYTCLRVTSNKEGYSNFKEDIEISVSVCNNNIETINVLFVDIDKEYEIIKNTLNSNASDTASLNTNLLKIKDILDDVVNSVITVNNSANSAIDSLNILKSDNPNDSTIQRLTTMVSGLIDSVNSIIAKFNQKRTLYTTAVSDIYNYNANSLRGYNTNINITLQKISSNGSNYQMTMSELLEKRQRMIQSDNAQYNTTVDNFTKQLLNAQNLPPGATVTYKGTYRDTGNRAMPQERGLYSYDSCLRTALSKGAKYFALQYGFNVNGGECALSNDWKASTRYGKKEDPAPLSNGKYYGSGWGNSIYEIVG
jgi:hypothetical protein